MDDFEKHINNPVLKGINDLISGQTELRKEISEVSTKVGKVDTQVEHIAKDVDHLKADFNKLNDENKTMRDRVAIAENEIRHLRFSDNEIKSRDDNRHNSLYDNIRKIAEEKADTKVLALRSDLNRDKAKSNWSLFMSGIAFATTLIIIILQLMEKLNDKT